MTEHDPAESPLSNLAGLVAETGVSARGLEKLATELGVPYSKSTINRKLNGDADERPDVRFTDFIVRACAIHVAGRRADLRLHDQLVRDARRHDHHYRVAAARMRYLAGKPIEPAGVPNRVLASWERLGREGHFDVPHVGDPDLDRPLVYYGQPIVDDLLDRWHGQPVSAILADPDAVVYTRRSTSKQLDRQLDAHDLVPGSCYAEKNAMTNGLGTASATLETAWIVGPEHLAEELQDDACVASVIRDHTDTVVGLINFTCRLRDASPHLITFAEKTADDISKALRPTAELQSA